MGAGLTVLSTPLLSWTVRNPSNQIKTLLASSQSLWEPFPIPFERKIRKIIRENRIFPDPSIFIDFSIQNGPTTIGIDRSGQCGHFGPCTFLRKSVVLPKTLDINCFFPKLGEEQWTFSKKYKDQNDRIGHIYRFQWSLDHFVLKNE